MSAKWLILAVFTPLFIGFCGKKLPPISDLQEVKLQMVADFTRDENIGKVSDADITPEGEFVFFDSRNGLLMGKAGNFRTIGSFGQGPGEYTHISSLWVDGGKIYTLHYEQKIIIYSLDGKVLWQGRISGEADRIIGRIGDELLLSGTDFDEKGRSVENLYLWRKDRPLKRIITLPIASYTQKRGNVVENFWLTRPAFALVDGKIFASASPTYEFSFYDLKGKRIKRVKLKAPSPSVPLVRKIRGASKVKTFSVLYAAPCGGKLCLITGYYRNDMPRLDVFTFQGKYLGSHILPLKYKYIAYKFKIKDGYLFYITPEETGFRVYKLPSHL